MPFAKGLSFQEFLRLDPLQYQKKNHRNCACIEFWSDVEEDWAYMDNDTRMRRLNQYFDYIRIKADDITHPLNGNKLFTKEDAYKIVTFIRKHQRDDIVVHCNEGISRTGAVIYVLERYFGYETGQRWQGWGISHQYNANTFVLKRLEESLGVHHRFEFWKVFLRMINLFSNTNKVN